MEGYSVINETAVSDEAVQEVREIIAKSLGIPVDHLTHETQLTHGVVTQSSFVLTMRGYVFNTEGLAQEQYDALTVVDMLERVQPSPRKR